ncbi:LuxR C-terminal-related transcriptional regulator [Micromonospora sp. HM5-17]|uniref:LuxR C-terminal-related transcriptional regulator n=1 Tax=Micromonospora sp. HM5-17 TaxID=2487710 RepID=UPI000F466BA9|nr:LuxR C-terminal-related transcriptional regulator [Micromonospora sp. HM5-17]ROT31729.1 hypothetical protein EF879_15135 [Micromonospora sp. HM5-17]
MGRWKFVGRTDELSRLVNAATSPDGRGLFLSGTAGVGKSRLLAQSLAQLPALDCAVWSASANIATAGIPFGGLAQVLPADQPAGLTPAGIMRWAVEALHQQAAGRRIVIGIDDAHLLDPSSAALVYLLARSENTTVLGTLRSGEPVPLPIRALWADDLVDHAELGPMTPAETGELLTAMLGGPVDAPSADRLHRLSADNALLLRELVIAAHASNELSQAYGVWRWTGRGHLPPSLDDLVDARIGQLDQGVRAVVELVAMGEPIGLTLLNRATDTTAVEVAEERGLIRVVTHDRRSDVRLAHPRQSVAQRLSELGESVDGPLPALMARHARAEYAHSGDQLLAVANDFAELELTVFAAEATSRAISRLRAARSSRSHEANLRLAALLRRCDVLRTPALTIRQPALTDRERQIARLAARGLASRNIAEQLYISTRTVENHLQRVYNKLGVADRSELWPALRAMSDPEAEPEG